MNQIVIVRPGPGILGALSPVVELKKTMRLDLKQMQEIVGGYIEIVHPDEMPPWACVVCDEEGKLKDRPVFWRCLIGGKMDEICGTFFVCTEGIVDGEPDLVPLTMEQAQEVVRVLYEQQLYEPQPTIKKEEKKQTKALTLPAFMDGIAGEICIEICKWRVTAEDDEDLERHCKDCPVNRLV